MPNYFKPMRRKIGVLTLAMACVFMGAWLRISVVSEELAKFLLLQDLEVQADFWNHQALWLRFTLWCSCPLTLISAYLLLKPLKKPPINADVPF